MLAPARSGGRRRWLLAVFGLGVAALIVPVWCAAVLHATYVVYVGGEWLPLLHPELWPGWTAVLLALVAGEVALAFVIFARGWSPAAAVANAALAVVVLSLALTGLGRGVLVNPAQTFLVGPGAAPNAVRVCLGPPRDREQLRRGLRALAEAIEERPEATAMIV